MQIKSLHIENFRCFKNLEVDFEKCHALIGENSSGKTTVLEALNLVSSPSYAASKIDEQDFHQDDGGDIVIEIEYTEPFVLKIPDGYTDQSIQCNKIKLTVNRRERAAPGKALSEPFVVEHICIPIIGGQVSQTREGYQYARKSGKPLNFSTRHLTLQSHIEGIPNVFYFDRSREKETKTGFNTLLQRILKDLNWRYRKDCDLNTMLSQWEGYYNPVIDKVVDPKKDQILTPVRERLKELTGTDYTDLEISLLDIEQPFSKAFFARRSKTNQVSSNNLGSGISILLAYLLLETMANRSKEKIILLIDEPELHLHPQLQQKLFNHFSSVEHQIIYTTQSDSMIKLTNWRGISRFSHDHVMCPKKEKLAEMHGYQTVDKHLDDIKNYNFDKKVFYKEDNQLFFARKCLLVEGPNDKYGIPVLAEKLGQSLDDLTIISCGGKGNIPHYKTLADAYGIPAFVIFDMDGNDDANTENKRIKDISTGTHFSFTDSFEKLLEAKGINKSELIQKVSSIGKEDIPNDIKDAINTVLTWKQS